MIEPDLALVGSISEEGDRFCPRRKFLMPVLTGLEFTRAAFCLHTVPTVPFL